MTDRTKLGASDHDGRWMGIKRHQGVLLIGGLTLGGDFILRPHATGIEGVTAVVMVTLSMPAKDLMSIGQWVAVLVRFFYRTRLSPFTVERTTLAEEMPTFELLHRGRMDLSGEDQNCIKVMMEVCDGLSLLNETSHVALYALQRGNERATVLRLPRSFGPASGFQTMTQRDEKDGAKEISLERWRYIRSDNAVVRYYQVHDFATSRSESGFMTALLRSGAKCDVAVHIEVLGARRGKQSAERAVHGRESDQLISSRSGYRFTAARARQSERLRERELSVASGRALLRLSVLIEVRGSNLRELRERCAHVEQMSASSGLRLHSGRGRQETWQRAYRYCVA